MALSGFARSVAPFVMERALLFPEERPLVALSGGADSCALLLVLCELAEAQLSPRPIGVAHFHHGMRGADADADAGFCASLAVRCGLACTIGLGALSGANEAQAREARYQFLHEAARSVNANVLVTAHHADDQAETVLLRVFRGTSLQGLSGIPARRRLAEDLWVARPLLGVRRSEIERYCTEQGIRVRHDPTNDDPRYQRQRVRAWFPELEQTFNPQLTSALNRLADHAAADNQVLETLTETLWQESLISENPLKLSRSTLSDAPLALRRRVLLRALWHAAPEAQEALATTLWVERLGELLQKGGVIDLPAGWRASSADRYLSLEKKSTKEALSFLSPLGVPGSLALPDGGYLVASLGVSKASAARLWQGKRVDCGTIPPSLQVRNVKPGDRLAPLGMGGKTRLVRDLLREAGVPAELRSRWPVVVNGDTQELLWLVGIAQAEATRVAEVASEVLILELKRDL